MNHQPIVSRTIAAAGVAISVLAAAVTPASTADDQIENAFRQSYVYRRYLKDDSVKAQSKEGVLTLSGTVAGENHRAIANSLGLGLEGVTRVQNDLTTKGEAAAKNSDLWISRKITFTLLLHRNVDAVATTVDVKEGVVTLSGIADSTAQRDLTGEYAGDIDGVKKVVNSMTINEAAKPGTRTTEEKLDDASVSANVHIALMMHRSTNSLETKVVTRNGSVTITGIAKNAAEKALVSKLAKDVDGIDSVSNEMTVAKQ